MYRSSVMGFGLTNDTDHGAATIVKPFASRHISPLPCIGLCTPGMGVISWGASPLYETGSLKEVNIPNDRSD